MKVFGILTALTGLLAFAAVKTHVSNIADADGGTGCLVAVDSTTSQANELPACCTGISSVAAALVRGPVTTPKQEAARSEPDGDWPMWGGDIARNMHAKVDGVSLDFNLKDGTNVAWTVGLGSQTYGNAIVADGHVYVGTNNGAQYRPKHEGDRGCLICFDEETGEFLWQLTREKLPTGRVNDWPLQGICSTPAVEGERMWVVTNRCELMCLDTKGFRDNENDGDYQEEVDAEQEDADIVWSIDMMDELGVFPHNLATSSPVVYGDMVYILTSNGVDEAHLELPSPRAPSFLAVNKETGEIAWEDNTPFDKILHGQWSSPAVGIVDGKAQVYFPGGDGWLYALDANTGEHIWKFDLNPKQTKWELGGAGTRNAVIASPVVIDNSVIIAVGQDPEHGEGVGHLWRIDATKTGDISSELGEIGQPGTPNPNSGVIWHYGGTDEDGSITGKPGRTVFRRTMSTVAVGDGLLFAADLSGFVHCIDFKTGQRYWEHDLFSGIWGSPMLADGKVFIGVEDGKLIVYEANKEAPVVLKEYDTQNYSSIYSTPTFANGKMFVTDRARLYAIQVKQ